LVKETLQYVVQVDEKLAEQKSREAAAQKQKADAERKRLYEQRENDAWQRALTDNTIETYNQFLVDYKGGKYYATVLEKIDMIRKGEEYKKAEQDVDIAMQANAIAELEALRNKYPSQKERINKHLRDMKCYEISDKYFYGKEAFPRSRGKSVYFVQDNFRKCFAEFQPIFSAYGKPKINTWNSEEAFESAINEIINNRFDLDERDIIKTHYAKVEGADFNSKNEIDFLDIGKSKKYTLTRYKFDKKKGRVLIGDDFSKTCFDISQTTASSSVNYNADNQEFTLKISSGKSNVFDVELRLTIANNSWIDINVSNGKANIEFVSNYRSNYPYKPIDISTEKSLVFRFRITNADKENVHFWITGDGENPLNPIFEQEGMLQDFNFPRNAKEKSFKLLSLKSNTKSVNHYIESIEHTIFHY
jgi:molybdopterin converting factor small subunit